MDTRPDDRSRTKNHGVVILARALFLLLMPLSLVGGVAGGLLRACTAPPPAALSTWIVSAAASHAALMICGFLGTVIGIERAVAVKHAAAFVAPLASGAGGLLLLLSHPVWSVVTVMFGAAAFFPLSATLGAALFGTSLVLLAAWLFAFDVARRTLRVPGLPRYMAVCLLIGYAWLAIAGAAWIASAAELPTRDMALHALGLGFVVGMMMAHAPVVLPAVARVKVRFGSIFYVPLAALHLSLLLRLGFGYSDFLLRGYGAFFNAVALALFVATMVGAAIAWRIMAGARPASKAS